MPPTYNEANLKNHCAKNCHHQKLVYCRPPPPPPHTHSSSASVATLRSGEQHLGTLLPLFGPGYLSHRLHRGSINPLGALFALSWTGHQTLPPDPTCRKRGLDRRGTPQRSQPWAPPTGRCQGGSCPSCTWSQHWACQTKESTLN